MRCPGHGPGICREMSNIFMAAVFAVRARSAVVPSVRVSCCTPAWCSSPRACCPGSEGRGSTVMGAHRVFSGPGRGMGSRARTQTWSMVWTLLMVMANESGSPVSGWRRYNRSSGARPITAMCVGALGRIRTRCTGGGTTVSGRMGLMSVGPSGGSRPGYGRVPVRFSIGPRPRRADARGNGGSDRCRPSSARLGSAQLPRVGGPSGAAGRLGWR